jgi:hypothetical protein
LGAPTPVDVGDTQSTRAAIGGVDWSFTQDRGSGRRTFGTLLGAVRSDLDFDRTGNSATFDSVTYGRHAACADAKFREHQIITRNDLALECTVPALVPSGARRPRPRRSAPVHRLNWPM